MILRLWNNGQSKRCKRPFVKVWGAMVKKVKRDCTKVKVVVSPASTEMDFTVRFSSRVRNFL